jgi:hypothetical protein
LNIRRTALIFLCAAGVAQGQEVVTLRRFADMVAVRQGPDATEKVLYYFSPTTDLVQGDEIEQGGGSHSELTLSASGLVALNDPAHVVLQKIDPEGDVLRFHRVSRARVRAGSRALTLLLPGGWQCRLQDTVIEIHEEFGRLRVRNTGGLTARLTGSLGLARHDEAAGATGVMELFDLGSGQEVRLPLFGMPDASGMEVSFRWDGVLVRHDDGIEAKPDKRVLRVRGPAGAELSVGGVRTQLRVGGVLTLQNFSQEAPEG